MKNTLIISNVEDFIKNKKCFDFNYHLSELSDRITLNELIDTTKTEIHGQIKGNIDKFKRPFIHLNVQGNLKLVCQICLKPLDFSIDEKVDLIIFKDEKSLENTLAENFALEGIVIQDNTIDVIQLIEEQILLALSFSPRHESCENEQLKTINQDKPNPFSILKN